MQEFFSSTPVLIIIGLVGIAIAVMIGKMLLKGICWLLFTAETALTAYCEKHKSNYGSFLMACSFAAGWFLFTIPMDSPLNTWNSIPLLRIAGILSFVVPLIKIIVQAKLHAPLVFVVKLISIPLHILCLVVGTVCAFLSCTPEPKKPVVYYIEDEFGRTIYYTEKDKDGNPIPIKIIGGPSGGRHTPGSDHKGHSPTSDQGYPPSSDGSSGWQDWGSHGGGEQPSGGANTSYEGDYRPFGAEGEQRTYDSDYSPMD